MPESKSDNRELQKKLAWKRENAYGRLAKDERQRLDVYCREYLGFSNMAKTEREAFHQAVIAAEEMGYRNLDDLSQSAGSLKPGAKVYRNCRDKTIMLAHIGEKPLTDGLHIVGGHVDAPRLDNKPNPLYEDSELVLLDTHYYGGIKKYQWVTMPLAIHGVVIKQDGEKVNIVIGEKDDDPVFVVSDLLPHLAKDQIKKKMNEGVPGENLNVLFGSVPLPDSQETKDAVKLHMLDMLHKRYGITEEDFASAELEIVPAGRARDLGFDRSMMLAYGHDDRVCAYAALRAILNLEETPTYTSVVLLCDKEEIGSVGATGMESTFFENTTADLISRANDAYSDLMLRCCLENSRMLSADVCAAHDPNYPEVSSPNNMARLNAGIAISKYGGGGGKARSSEASAEFMAYVRQLFNKNGVVWQSTELGKVDQGGGGTIAMFLARYGMDVVDCGVPLLSMHAPWEVAAKLDAYMTYKGYHAFLGATQ